MQAQKEKATEKEKVCWAEMACRAVRYADMDRWTPGYTNEIAYKGVNRSARPTSAPKTAAVGKFVADARREG